ncbi:MAG: DUF1573 domain-containing protein [Bacteroidales bacterium]|nr:DUF1573 domain-containing protein [Bacteroidales bacterium]
MIARIIILCSLLALIACSGNSDRVPASVVNVPGSASGQNSDADLPQIEFEKTEHNFGRVIQGEKVTFAFKFKNSGKADLLIANVTASCGCTAYDFPRAPIKPGQQETIRVTFDSSGREGFQSKSVTIATNAQPSITNLVVKAQIYLPEKRR